MTLSMEPGVCVRRDLGSQIVATADKNALRWRQLVFGSPGFHNGRAFLLLAPTPRSASLKGLSHSVRCLWSACAHSVWCLWSAACTL